MILGPFGITTEYGVSTIKFMPSSLSTSKDQITVFRGRENILDIYLKHDGVPIDLTVFESFELFGLSDTKIDSKVDPLAIQGSESGLLQLNVGLLTTKKDMQSTTLVGFGPSHLSGVVLWDRNLPRASVSADIVDTLTPGNGTGESLTNGIRFQLKSRTNNAVLAGGTGFIAYLIEHGAILTNLSTDTQGYILIQHASLVSIGEKVTVGVISPDGALTGLEVYTVEDVTTYIT